MSVCVCVFFFFLFFFLYNVAFMLFIPITHDILLLTECREVGTQDGGKA